VVCKVVAKSDAVSRVVGENMRFAREVVQGG